jgi:Putative Flp pilus-assembly TadE/G-like
VNRRREAGHVLPLIAVMLGVLMGFGGLGVDVGFWEYRQQAQQNATDAAALGGAQVLAKTSCSDPVTAKAQAGNDAGNNGFANGGSVVVTLNSPPAAGPFSGQTCAISVSITTQHVNSYFSRLLGYSQGVTETTSAVAAVSNNSSACIYLLSPVVSTNINGAQVNAPGCAIAINDTANFNGATVGSPMIGYAGGAPNENGATFTMATPAPMLPVLDPCSEIPGCAYLTNNPPSQSGCQQFNGNGYTGSLAPGCYSSLNLNHSNVTLNNGIYTFTGSTNFNSSTLTGSNVTIYVASGATPPNWNSDTVNLTPPTTGNYANVLYYQVPSNTANPNFNGTGVSLRGLIYCPNSTSVNFNGARGGYMVLVFGAMNYNGSDAWDFATPPPGQSITSKAVIAQ